MIKLLRRNSVTVDSASNSSPNVEGSRNRTRTSTSGTPKIACARNKARVGIPAFVKSAVVQSSNHARYCEKYTIPAGSQCPHSTSKFFRLTNIFKRPQNKIAAARGNPTATKSPEFRSEERRV